ncbi:site-specific integrase [Sinorhizobium kummerowiae]|uniref:Site-specific integrase n=1 Tax=Sinorhizobium kummerowiae TaxID=158892 RepID=A0ABY8TDN1_9HYPH|nr:site-specific integrase [Sinorhizobium kummerowiae]WHS95355.1 site-specific integrase [Sinorhizobium kummerowiae]WRW47322.1 site-specific integrase [Sinorhizobium kummerowiae]
MATIRKRGDKWQVQIRRQGFPPISRSFHTKSDAAEWARYWESKADRAELPDNRKVLDTISLADLVKRYRDEVVIAKRGREIETIILNAFLKEPICRKKLSALSSEDFTAYRDKRLEVISGKSLSRQLSPLSNMFNVAKQEWGIPIKSNPLAKLRIGTKESKRERRLRANELAKLVHAARKTRNPLILPIVLFALETAMRRGEILSMRWHHIDLDRRSVVIPETKNGYPRTIPLTSKAMVTLQGIKRDSERVFPIQPNALRLSWTRLTHRASIKDLHFHDLRHEAISRFFEMGLTVPEVASISGHRDIRMLMRYAHADAERLAKKLP